MNDNSSNNKRIAKNTGFLYIRTLFVMFISLYTSRLILQALGVENYGIYNVIGGVVSMFSVISTSLSAAISRFITFEIGKGNKERLKEIFSTSIIIQLVLATIVFVVCEIVGNWFMEYHMQIPPDRLYAAHWVLHCSLISFCICLLSLPYEACIIAHERMGAFAFISIYEAIMKLIFCLLVFISPIDRLIFHAILMLCLSLLTRAIYTIYCNRNFEETHSKLKFDKAIFKEMLGFSGWNFFDSTANLLNNQGLNMLMNVYFGVIVNAARGIAIQVENAVLKFVYSFTMAINPQITKYYASGNLQNMHKLVCRGAKFSFYLMLLLGVPIIIKTRQILNLWLVDVPEYAVTFVQLSLIMGICDSISSTGYTACMATGKIKKYSIIITSINLLVFILSWILFAMGAEPQYAYYVYISIKITIIITRMFLLKSMVGLKIKMYIKNVFVPIINTSIIAVPPPIIVSRCVEENILTLILVLAVSVISTTFSVLCFGMTKNERNFTLTKVKDLIKKTLVLSK